MNTVTQAFEDVKKDAPAGLSAEYYTGYSQIDCNPTDHRVSGSMRGFIVDKILNGGNDEALALLSSVGQIEFVPGIGENSIPLNAFADFYGVSEKYLAGLLQRSRLIWKSCPNDITRMRLSDIIAAKAPLTPCCESQQKRADDLVTYHINGSHCQMKVSLPKGRLFSLYSPRIVLAAALMMVYTDKSDVDGNIKKTLLAIKRSPYRFIKKAEVEQMNGLNQPKPDDGIPVTAGGELRLSPELFTHMIKTAVKEAVAEVLNEVRMPAAGQPVPVPGAPKALQKPSCAKLKKPDQWDAIVALWKSGSLSAAEAARMAGMCESSFRGYAGGRKSFD